MKAIRMASNINIFGAMMVAVSSERSLYLDPASSNSSATQLTPLYFTSILDFAAVRSSFF